LNCLLTKRGENDFLTEDERCDKVGKPLWKGTRRGDVSGVQTAISRRERDLTNP
jgi:hypothetical protein